MITPYRYQKLYYTDQSGSRDFTVLGCLDSLIRINKYVMVEGVPYTGTIKFNYSNMDGRILRVASMEKTLFGIPILNPIVIVPSSSDAVSL